jgi:tRNA A37 threonylcarbamoyladenosine synthetase subunit TsaC/SUA5/YrdC
LNRLLPGAVTLLFNRKSSLPIDFNQQSQLIGVRVPDCQFIRELCRRVGEPLAQTSANISGNPVSPLCIQV